MTSTRLLAERPETVRTVIAAFHDALLASRDDPQLGLDALLDQIPGADRGLVVAGWEAGMRCAANTIRLSMMRERGSSSAGNVRPRAA